MRLAPIACALALALPALTLAGCSRPAAHAVAAPSASAPHGSAPVAAADVVLTTLSDVPGRRISATKGFACRFFAWNGRGSYTAQFEGALQAFRAQAAHNGAHAVVNLRLAVLPASAGSSASAIVNICGDETTLE